MYSTWQVAHCQSKNVRKMPVRHLISTVFVCIWCLCNKHITIYMFRHVIGLCLLLYRILAIGWDGSIFVAIDSGSFNKVGKGLIFSTSVCLIPLSQRDAMSDSLKIWYIRVYWGSLIQLNVIPYPVIPWITMVIFGNCALSPPTQAPEKKRKKQREKRSKASGDVRYNDQTWHFLTN